MYQRHEDFYIEQVERFIVTAVKLIASKKSISYHVVAAMERHLVQRDFMKDY